MVVRHAAEDGRETVVSGCDLFEFVGDRIRVKDAYRKVEGFIGGHLADISPQSD